jgi:putative transposase
VGAESLPRSEKSKIPERGSKSLRLGRWSEENGIYFITTSCHERQQLFTDPQNVRIVFDCLEWLAAQGWIEMHFAVVMPDHLHLVLQLSAGKTLSDIMGSLKRYTSRRIRERTGLTNRVWQDTFYDHRIREDENLNQIVNYCWFNPVRKGLVNNPRDYPYWRSKYEME